MRLTGRILVASLILVLPAAAQQNDEPGLSLADVTARLSEPQVLRGQYTQTRQIAMLSRPLQSSGRFILADKGLYWEQLQPFFAVLMADGERLAQRMTDGPLTIVDGSRQPLVLSFSRIFLNMFRGEHADLAEHFSIRFDSAGDAWEIELTPTTFPMSEGITSIGLKGQDHIDRITVIGKPADGFESPDRMVISFSDLDTSPPELTEHEAKLYAW